MHRAFSSSMTPQQVNYTKDELIAYLTHSEYDDRQNRKVHQNGKILQSRFHIEYDNEILRYATCEFIKNNQNILITGSTGAGKSYIASALGHQAFARLQSTLL